MRNGINRWWNFSRCNISALEFFAVNTPNSQHATVKMKAIYFLLPYFGSTSCEPSKQLRKILLTSYLQIEFQFCLKGNFWIESLLKYKYS